MPCLGCTHTAMYMLYSFISMQPTMHLCCHCSLLDLLRNCNQ